MIDDIRNAAHAQCLDVFGALHENGDTIVLLGPQEPNFWAHATASLELNDDQPDPLDRWSKRIIDDLAAQFDASAIFPSDGPPYPAFISWATASNQAWIAPVGMLVHQKAGLFASYRGALRISGEITLPEATEPCPCMPCAQPCKSACPVNALTSTNYDVAACKAHITGPDTKSCRTQGCAARRVCPISQTYGRLPEQSAFHMRAFLGE